MKNIALSLILALTMFVAFASTASAKTIPGFPYVHDNGYPFLDALKYHFKLRGVSNGYMFYTRDDNLLVCPVTALNNPVDPTQCNMFRPKYENYYKTKYLGVGNTRFYPVK